MNKYVARIWVDIEFYAENREQAKKVQQATEIQVKVDKSLAHHEVQLYEAQDERVWKENGEFIGERI